MKKLRRLCFQRLSTQGLPHSNMWRWSRSFHGSLTAWRYTEMLSTFPSLQLQMDSTTSLRRPTRSLITFGVWIQRNSWGGLPFMLPWQTQWWPRWSRSKDQRTKLLHKKLAIIQEAQVLAVSAGFAAASNLQLLWRDALLKNFGFQLQVLSQVRTAPFEGPHVLGPEPKVLQNSVRAIRQADRMAGSSVTFVQKPKDTNKTSMKTTSSTKKNQARTVFERLGPPSTTTVQRTISQDQSFGAGAGAGQRWRGPGGGSPGRLCPTVEESAGLLSSHQHCWGRGGHNFPSKTSAHPSVHQLPHQEQTPGSPAGRGCLAGQGGHREGQQNDFSRVLQPTVPGAVKDRRSSSSNRLIHFEPPYGSSPLQDGNSGIRRISHQKSGVDSLHRHSRRLSPCPDAQGRKKVSAFCGQQTSLPIHLSPLRIGNFTSGVYKAIAPSRSSVKTVRCEATRLLRRLADPCRYSTTGPTACPDDHQCAPVSRLDHQLPEVRSNTPGGALRVKISRGGRLEVQKGTQQDNFGGKKIVYVLKMGGFEMGPNKIWIKW